MYVLSGGIFVLGSTEFVVAGLLPELAADLRVSLPEAGLLISAFAVAMVIGAPVLAVLTLRLPRKATLIGSLGLFVAGQVLGAVAPDYPAMMIGRIVTAAATGAFWAVASVVAVGLAEATGPGRRARAMALLMGGLTAANVLGVPLGTVLGQHLGWRATFWVIGGAAVVAALAVWRVLPRERVGSGALSGGLPRGKAVGRVPSGVPGCAENVNSVTGERRLGDLGTPTRGRGGGLRAEVGAFRGGRLWVALATTAVFEAGVMGAFTYLAPVVTDVAGFGAGAVPMALTLYGVGSLAGIQLGGRFADAYPWRTLFAGLAAVAGILLAIAEAAGVGAVTLVAAFGMGVAVFVAATPLAARALALAGPAPTLASAVNVSAFNVGNTLGPWLGGLVIAAGWGFRAPAALGAGLLAVAIALGLVSRALDGRR
ncbi:DHA1 family chloramphenicol resistance protein-like MFS transporter [Pseudonocardia eucalypti]|uniref:MFS transporter n=1 Tax=Pseudonocardia eucalypti TaxID=648755 RepID=UPI00183E2E26|nr:DHA1 family chloramphenicol resistance protein-like MFS transporter [Pseudonocardia eucalypti]